MKTLNLRLSIKRPGVAMDIVFSCRTFDNFWRVIESSEGEFSRMLGAFDPTWGSL
jgi:hypothetical protein